MENKGNLTRYADDHEEYKKKRADIETKCTRSVLCWLACLPVAVGLGVWIYSELVEWSFSDALEMLGSFLILVLTTVMFGWIWGAFAVKKARIERLNFAMSLKLMDWAFRNELGNYSEDEVEYPILQNHCTFAEIKRNKRLAWMDRDMPFLFHRARITNGDTGEDEEIYFDGIAVSVPATDDGWRDVDMRKMSTAMKKVWEPVFQEQICGNRTMFDLDKIDDSMWLTVGFCGLTLGERDVPWDDLQNWYMQCQKDVDRIRRAVDLAYTITPESCAKPKKK